MIIKDNQGKSRSTKKGEVKRSHILKGIKDASKSVKRTLKKLLQFPPDCNRKHRNPCKYKTKST